MMVVCHPEFSVNLVIGLDVLNPSIEVFIPMALHQAAFPNAGTTRFRNEVEVTHDAVPLILPHPCLNLLPYLVDGTKCAMELGELVVSTLKIGVSEIPGVVVCHLDVGQIVVLMEIVATIDIVENTTSAGGRNPFNMEGAFKNIGNSLFNLAERKCAKGDCFRSLR